MNLAGIVMPMARCRAALCGIGATVWLAAGFSSAGPVAAACGLEDR